MTDFKVGDRVRARSIEGNDKAKFDVTEVHGDYDYTFVLVGRGVRFDSRDWEFTLTHRPIELPSVAGIYGFTNGAGMKMLRTKYGQWYWIDFTAQGTKGVVRGGEPMEESEVRKQIMTSEVVLNYEYKERP